MILGLPHLGLEEENRRFRRLMQMKKKGMAPEGWGDRSGFPLARGRMPQPLSRIPSILYGPQRLPWQFRRGSF